MGTVFKSLQRLILVALALGSVFLPVATYAADADIDPFENLCGGGRGNTTLCQQAQQAQQDANGSRGLLGPEGIITKITQLIVYFTGAISVIMIIVGGFKYVLSGGDSNGVQSAKNTIMYALIGLVVAIFSQVIVSFVLSRL